MERNFYTPENIEAYLENSLSPKEKALFESEIAKDPLLKNELGLQKDIVESLKSYRKLELKNRLNSIEVSLSPNYLGAKIAASVILSGLLGMGIYSYFYNNTGSAPAIGKENKELTYKKPVAEVSKNDFSVSNSEIKNETKTADLKDKKTVDLKERSIVSSSSDKKSTALSKSVSETKNIKPASPSIDESFDTELFQKDEAIKLPEGKIAQTTETRSNIDIHVDGSTDKKFHYKYYNNKLFLYGDFDSKTYEIIELNTYKGKQVYLYYDNNYYQLIPNQLEVSPLRKITDKKVLDELHKLDK